MRNIHILPTDKISDISLGNSGEGMIHHTHTKPKYTYRTYQNLYISSDEEVKEGDWLLIIDDFETYVHKHKGDNLPTTYHKKIILTTDQDLDGVQAIDDEFLEWFIKNPSCEEVEVRYTVDFNSKAVIIIPKEKTKQETLEEAAEKYATTNKTYSEQSELDFKAGAYWQAERMYSEEDLINFAEFVARYPDKNRNHTGQMLHAKSKYDGAERTIDLLQVWSDSHKV